MRSLRDSGQDCRAYSRDEEAGLTHLSGHVIDCAGVTWDFRARPFDTVEAHVSRVMELIERCHPESYLYLSSTRVYKRVARASEEAELLIDPKNFDDIYGTSKLMGESIILTNPLSTFRVVRLSNVYGRGSSSMTFVNSLVDSALATGEIRLGQTLDSIRDYVDIEDVLPLLIRIVSEGKNRLYNIASGANISNQQIVEVLTDKLGCKVSLQEPAETVRFPRICIDRVRSEFGFMPRQFLDRFAELIQFRCLESNADVTH